MNLKSENWLVDGDVAFIRCNNRKPAHALSPGEFAAATNCRSENGKLWPRFGIALDPWGITGRVMSPDSPIFAGGVIYYSNLIVGETYYWLKGNAGQLDLGSSTLQESGRFTAPFTSAQVSGGTSGTVYGGRIIRIGANVRAYKRFSDALTNSDNTILITDDWRDANGEDGGRGRAFRIIPGNTPQAISLNGHDVWDTCRLVQCDNAMILLRHGNQRYYFTNSALDELNDQVQLNVTPYWASTTARRVRFELATAGASVYGLTQNITNTSAAADTITVANHGRTNGDAAIVTGLTGLSGIYYLRSVTSSTLSLYDTAAHAIAGGATGKVDITVNSETGTLTDRIPAAGNYYYAKNVGSNKIEFYTSSTLATKLIFSAGSFGKFYIEEAQDPTPFFGDGANNLIMQPSAGGTAFENGFLAVLDNVAITDTDATTDILTAPTHRLQPGDAVSGTAIGGVSWEKFAAPQSPHTLRLYDTVDNAQVDDGVTGLVNLTTDDQTGSIWKSDAAGVPMPPCREGAYVNGRFIGITGRDTVVISDPNDFLHFTVFVGTVPANQGEAGNANWLLPFGDNVVAVGKDLNVIGIAGLGGSPDAWSERNITTEFNGIAALAALQKGTDLWFASRKGFVSVIRTVAGETLGAPDTISDDIPLDLLDIDWLHADSMCAETWNNRLFWAVPTKGQETVVNNKVLVLNCGNDKLYVEQSIAAGELVGGVRKADGKIGDSWEGAWSGDLLTPYAFAKLKVGGEERLTFVTPDGLVCWFHDGFDDNGAEIATTLATRAYFGGARVHTQFGNVQWETFRPSLTVVLKTAGYNEQTTQLENLVYDKTKYLAFDAPAYDLNTATAEGFQTPHREDYAPAPEELLVAELDVHQNSTQRIRPNARDRSPQLVISNVQGSARIVSTTLKARAIPNIAARQT